MCFVQSIGSAPVLTGCAILCHVSFISQENVIVYSLYYCLGIGLYGYPITTNVDAILSVLNYQYMQCAILYVQRKLLVYAV